MASNLRVDSIVPATGSSVSIGTATGGVNIPGVLTYEDVTNVDSIGIITARDGLRVTGVTTITGTGEYLLRLNKSDSSAVYTQFTNSTSGTSTSDGFRIGMDSNEDGLVWLREDGNVKFGTNNSERLRITSAGNVGINDNNPANQLVVKAPGGSGHCTAKVLSGDASTTVFLQSVQGTEGRLGVESNHPLAIYAGAAQRLVVGSTGIIDAPLQAGFYARLNSNLNDKTGDGTYYTVQWDTDSGSVCYDQHSTFDTGTGLYTVPSGGNGIYQLSTAVCLSSDVYGRQGEAWFLTNTGLRVFFDRRYFPSATGTITGFYGTCLLKLNAGQTVGVQIFVNGGSKNVDVLGAGAGDHISWFSGRKIA